MLGTGMRIYFFMYCRETLIFGNSLILICFEGPRLSFADHLWVVSTDSRHQGRTSVNNLELSMQGGCPITDPSVLCPLQEGHGIKEL